MCCFSHEEVNNADILQHGIKYVIALMARDERLRCQCKFGDKCNRQMTQEDLLCDYCRSCRHSTECQDEHGLPFVETKRMGEYHIEADSITPFEKPTWTLQ
jgi:hypothetical protein